MSEEKKKTIEDIDESLRRVLRTESVAGDTRRTNKRFRKGHTFYFNDYDRPFTLTEDVTMDVTEEFHTDGRWHDKRFHVDTTRTVPKKEEPTRLGRWARLRMWLFNRGGLPQARVVR